MGFRFRCLVGVTLGSSFSPPLGFMLLFTFIHFIITHSNIESESDSSKYHMYRYTVPFSIEESCTVRARVFDDATGTPLGVETSSSVTVSK